MSDDCIWSSWMWQNWTTMNLTFQIFPVWAALWFLQSRRLLSFKILLDISLFMFPLWRAELDLNPSGRLRYATWLCFRGLNPNCVEKENWDWWLEFHAVTTWTGSTRSHKRQHASSFCVFLFDQPDLFFHWPAQGEKEGHTFSHVAFSFFCDVPFLCIVLGQTCA